MSDNVQSSSNIVRKCNYFCKKCDYTCQDFSNWDKHTKTNMHITKRNANTEYNENELEFKLCKYSCCKQATSSWKEAWKENCVCLRNIV